MIDPTLAQARAHVQKHAILGIDCPCCDRRLVARVRNLNSNMASALVRLYYLSVVRGEGWVHTPSREVDPQREMAKLVFWGLVESQVNTDSTKRCSGWWRPTELGVAFVLRQILVPGKVLVSRNSCVGRSDGSHELLPREYVGINDALSTRFDYESLMEGRG